MKPATITYTDGRTLQLLENRELTADDDERIRAKADGIDRARIMKIRMRGRGRRDVPSSAFDDDRPVTLYLTHGEILDLVGKPVSEPKERRVPKAKFIKGGLAIGPDLIGRNQIIIYKVLAREKARGYRGYMEEDWVNTLTVQSSLIDVRVRQYPGLEFFDYFLGFLIVFTGGAIVTGLLFWIARASNNNTIQQLAAVGIGVTWLYLGFYILGVIWQAVTKLVAVIRQRYM